MFINKLKKLLLINIIILLINPKYIFASSNVIYPKTNHLYHKNYSQIKIKEQIYSTNFSNTITFGSYEQDGNPANGKELIEWIVLDHNNESQELTLLSKYILDCVRFNGFSEPVTWETSSLRKYLNEKLINEMFNSNELMCILDTFNSNPPNFYNDAYSGEDTIDKLYIPSINDIYNYFTNANLTETERYQELLKPNFYRSALATNQAIINGVRVMGAGNKYPLNGNYLLRTKAPTANRIWYNDVYESNYITFITEIGEVKPEGTGISSTDDGIRIMLRVKY